MKETLRFVFVCVALFLAACACTKPTEVPEQEAGNHQLAKTPPAQEPAPLPPALKDAVFRVANDFGMKIQDALAKWECPDISTDTEKTMWSRVVVSFGFRNTVKLQLTGVLTGGGSHAATSSDVQTDGYYTGGTPLPNGGGWGSDATWVAAPGSFSVFIQDMNTGEYTHLWFHEDGCKVLRKGTAAPK